MTIWEQVIAELRKLADRHDDLHRKVDRILAKDDASSGQQAEPGGEGQDTA